MLTPGQERAREKEAHQDGVMPEEMTGSPMTPGRLSPSEIL
jgi:hypothetical protein